MTTRAQHVAANRTRKLGIASLAVALTTQLVAIFMLIGQYANVYNECVFLRARFEDPVEISASLMRVHCEVVLNGTTVSAGGQTLAIVQAGVLTVVAVVSTLVCMVVLLRANKAVVGE